MCTKVFGCFFAFFVLVVFMHWHIYVTSTLNIMHLFSYMYYFTIDNNTITVGLVFKNFMHFLHFKRSFIIVVQITCFWLCFVMLFLHIVD